MFDRPYMYDIYPDKQARKETEMTLYNDCLKYKSRALEKFN